MFHSYIKRNQIREQVSHFLQYQISNDAQNVSEYECERQILTSSWSRVKRNLLKNLLNCHEQSCKGYAFLMINQLVLNANFPCETTYEKQMPSEQVESYDVGINSLLHLFPSLEFNQVTIIFANVHFSIRVFLKYVKYIRKMYSTKKIV